MNRKKTAFGFILLAGFLMMAHAVIPHHHHHRQVCFVHQHCVNDVKAHTHNESEPDHQHDSNSNPNMCFLSEFVPTSNNNSRICNSQQSDDNNSAGLQFILFVAFPGLQAPVVKANSPFKDFTPLYSSILYSSTGLRAPPVSNVKC